MEVMGASPVAFLCLEGAAHNLHLADGDAQGSRLGNDLCLEEEIPIGFHGYAFKPRKLACLEDFIGGPAWVLSKDRYPA
jgi:hypothetical protein